MYDWLLGSPALRRHLTPDFALQLGASPVSSSLERLVQEGADGMAYGICAESGWPDPLHKSARVLRSGASELLSAACAALEQRKPRRPSSRVRLWKAANTVAAVAVRHHVAQGFGEAPAVAAVCDAVPESSILAIGNSLPPRLLDRYCPVSARGIDICCQRGASGIEGAIAGVLGAASQTSAPATLLVGDISFLHDVGSLWAAQPAHTHVVGPLRPIVIVVLNNAGGRIFEQLPIAAYPGVSLHFWTTPHQLELKAAADLYKLEFAQARDRTELALCLRAAYAHAGVTLIEIVVDPDSAMRSLRALTAELEPQLALLAETEPT
jgi:2-succinyl-5-enolpyruvyl-6-hydroxy-3-cyclohexene-1-carboxylate synthase